MLPRLHLSWTCTIRIISAFAIILCLGLPNNGGIAIARVTSFSPDSVTSSRITIDFETLSDLTGVSNQYSYIGVNFTGARILTQGGSLNYINFPPKSGRNVIYDDIYADNTGTITISFDAVKTGIVSKVGCYITGNRVVTMSAYDANGGYLGSSSTSGPNYADVGTPNQILEITSSISIAKVIVHDSGNTFTIDDFYFESEQGCQIINVPLYKQYRLSDESWANDDYGGTNSNPWKDPNHPDQNAKVKDWGCSLTSAAMVVSFYGLQQTGRTTNPHELNEWLKGHGGYSGGNIIWYKVAEFARDGAGAPEIKGQGVAPQFYYYPGWGPDDGTVNGFLCNSNPIILNTNTIPYQNGHFVVATGQAGSNAWMINDPGQYNLSQLSTTAYSGFRKYSDSPRDPTAIYIAIHSPVEILITDPAGRMTGYNPNTGQYINGIIDADYRLEVLGASDGTGKSVITRVFETGTPISGDYTIELYGIDNGSYEIDFIAYDSSGTSSKTSIQNYISNNTEIWECQVHCVNGANLKKITAVQSGWRAG